MAPSHPGWWRPTSHSATEASERSHRCKSQKLFMPWEWGMHGENYWADPNVIRVWGLPDRSFKISAMRGGEYKKRVKKTKRFSTVATKWGEDVESRGANVTNITCIEYFQWTKQTYGLEEEKTYWQKLGFGHFSQDSRLKAQLWVVWGRIGEGGAQLCIIWGNPKKKQGDRRMRSGGVWKA